MFKIMLTPNAYSAGINCRRQILMTKVDAVKIKNNNKGVDPYHRYLNESERPN